MPEFHEYLAILSTDPDDPQALTALENMGAQIATTPEAGGAFDEARKALRERGELDVVARLFDVEINAVTDQSRRADLLLEKGHLLADDLLNEESAVECFNAVLEIRPEDEDAQETLAHFGLVRENWKKIVEKYLDEAKVSTDRQLTTSLYLSAAEHYARYEASANEVETYLRKALEVDGRNRKAAIHLERLLRREERWEELTELLEQRVDAAAGKEERIQALLGIADLAKARLDRPELAVDCMKKVVASEPAHPRALRMLSDAYEHEENWSALVMLYTNALKSRRGRNRDQEVGTLLQIAMLHWKRLDNLDSAEEYFRRIRKAQPAHPAALDFYRVYYPPRSEVPKLLQVLRQAQKSLSGDEHAEQRKAISVEIAEIAETQLGSPEKAIDAWKGILRADKESEAARTALKRLYRKTEKWNALLDLMKDEIERVDEGDVTGRVERLMDVVAIYRDRLKLDVMVINTYNSILKLDPHNKQALDDLADKYKQLGRWNDLIAVLTKKADVDDSPPSVRADILREIAGLWSDRFGNYAQAIKPLEKLLDIVPDDADAIASLKEIYTRRRQWRGLIGLLGREADGLPIEERRDKLAEMARLSAERLGDNRLSIETWNRVLELPGAEADADALAALCYLYEREKRYLALVDIYRRQRATAEDDVTAVGILEKMGATLADRLDAPAQAAEAFGEILTLDPQHNRALRTLRELYAAAHDYDALEKIYGELGQWDELVDAFFAISDRLEARDERLGLLERSAAIASEHFDNPGKIARAYERVLSVDPEHLASARALVPVYEKTEKWARLLSTFEILLAHADSEDDKLELHLKIRDLCENQLGSKAQAFQWNAKAYQMRPNDDELLDQLMRLAAEADQWDEVCAILDARVKSDDIADDKKLDLLRELGKISAVRLHKPERARAYQQQVLALSDDDPEALDALEEIATQMSDWPDLLSVYRRRVDMASDDSAKVDLLFKVAFIEEERLADLDGAAGTYLNILDIKDDSQRAMRALGKIQEARGDWEGLADVIQRELAHSTDADANVELHLRAGGLYETSLDRPHDALRAYRAALDLAPRRKQVHDALERFLDGDGSASRIDTDSRVDVATLLLPIYEQADDAAKIARAFEVLRMSADDVTKLEYDRRLANVYGERLGETTKAYDAGERVLIGAPADGENRAALLRYAELLDRHSDLADTLSLVLAESEGIGMDPSDQRAIATELASLYDDRIGAPEKAEKAWLKVLSIEPTEERAYDALDRIYRGAERWTDLRDLLLRREDNTLDGDRRKDILLSICDLEEGVLDNATGAIEAYRRVLEVDPSMMRAYKALERLYGEAGKWRLLEELVGNELDYVEGQEHVDLTYKRAELRARKLEDPDGAIELLEDVVARHRSNADARELLEELLPNPDLRLRIARILEPLYEQDGLWRDLCLVLRAQREFADGSHEAAELLCRVATYEEEQMGSERAAFDTWREALEVEPSDERPRVALRRLGSMLERWEDVAGAYEEALNKADVSLRGELLAELASIYDVSIADAARATSAYKRLLDTDPGNPETVRKAAEALDRLYYEEQRWPELIDIIRKQADWAETTEERVNSLARVAVINEEQLEDTDAAIATWREVSTEDPEEPRALDALERLFTAGDKYRDLIEILRRRVEMADAPDMRKVHLRRIAQMQEMMLENRDEAIMAHLEILDYLPDDQETMIELSRLYRAGERYTDLLETIERRLAVIDEVETRLELTFEIGTLLNDHLQRESEALERFAEVLQTNPGHPRAIETVERMLDDDDLRRRASEILQPLYEAADQHDKLANLLLRVADAGDDPREGLRALRQVAIIREQFLEDKPGAFDVTVRAVKVAVAEPELAELLADTERLAAALGREGDLIDVYQEVAPDVLDGDLQRRLYLDVADLARAVRDDTDLAKDNYQRVLDSQPDDSRAMNALESIYRVGEEHEKLYEILVRKADLAGDDLDVRAAALAESARLCAGVLDRPEDAVMAWEQVLDITPENKEGANALEKLYETGERWHDLVDLLERRLGFAFTVEEAVALRCRLGDLHEHQLLDPDSAVENYSAALGGDPNNSAATAALERFLDDPGTRNQAAEVLEPVYVAHQDWPKLVRIYEIKLDAADEPGERLALTRYIARLYEDQLEDLEGAFRWYGRVFRESPGDAALRDQLSRLATILEDYQGLANVYQEYLDDESGDSQEVHDVALALADIYDRRLDEVERGMAAYRRVLDSTPEDLATFGRLESMLIRAERWYAVVEIYEEAVVNTMDDARRIELHSKSARVLEEHMDDLNRAVEAYRAVLDIEPDHAGAADELDRLYTAQKKWYELAELLNARVERSTTSEQENAFRMKLADTMQNRLDDAPSAIEQYEVVLRSNTGWEQALAPLEHLVMNENHRERIAELLEPVYRANDWWQKLVVILDAQLAYVDDPERRVSMLREIAQIHETRGGDQLLALDALARAWKENVSDSDVYDELQVAAARIGAWDSLIETLEAGIKDNYDYDLVTQVLARIAEIHETQRQDNAAAITAWTRALEVNDADPLALTALDRLYSAENEFEKLVKIIERRAELADDAGVRLVMLHRIAALHEEQLDNVGDAIAAYKNVLSVDDTDGQALDALERLYRSEGDHSELANTLVRKIELQEDAAERRRLRFAAAEVYDEHLNDQYEAIAQMISVIDEDPDDAAGLGELDRLYERDKMWPELLEILDRRVALEGDAAQRAELAFRAAKLVEVELLEYDAAIDRLAAVIEQEPSHGGARAALDSLTKNEDTLDKASAVLERLYRAEGDNDHLVELYERKLATPAAAPEVRREQYTALAEVHEVARGDLDAAFAVWARALAETPDDRFVQGQLERLTAARGTWEQLAKLFEERLTDIVDSELEYAYAVKLASLYEEALGDLDRAATKYRQALEVANDELPPLAALDRIYTRAGKFEDLAEILTRQADATMDDGAQADFLFRLGDLREVSLDDIPGAVGAYRDVLDRSPQHTGARGALERLLSTAESERADIINILEPLYDAEGDFGRLADLLTAKLTITEDHLDRSQIYLRIAEIAETKLADSVRALDATGGWLVEDPLSAQALSELERLAATVGRWDEVAARLAGIIESADSDDVKRPLMLKLGEVQLNRTGDIDSAVATFRTVLELEPESVAALDSLQHIYRSRGDAAHLAEVLWKKADVTFEAEPKRACFVEVAGLREHLQDIEGAIVAWKEVLDLDEGDRDAHARLAVLYEHQGQYDELIEVLGIAARFAADADEERGLRTRIARLYTDVMEQPDDAVDAWQAVLDVAPDAVDALVALEAVHTKREDWLAVQEILNRRLDMVDTSAERIAIFTQLATLSETRRESIDEAIGFMFQILDIDNAHFPTYAALERMLGAAERWHDVVELLERVADVHGTLGNSDQEIATYAKAVDVWEGPLENPEAAGDLLEKILARDPNYVPALTRLAKLYESNAEWDRCQEILQQALALGPQGRDAADLYFRLGEVTRNQSGDLDQAVGYWSQALQYDGSHPAAIKAVEDYAREKDDWNVVADMVTRREQVSTDPAEKLDLTLELADLYSKKLGQPDAVVPLLERAVQSAPDDPRVLGPLADLYFASGRHGDASPIYERLADEAKKSRRMKEVAKYRQRLGGIFEAQNETEKALAAYEEAFRVNPTDVQTMAGLGRIYFAAEDWEKARRVYRSMVLQNLDPDLGISKADVYYNLGTIHLKLGEDNKAKGMFQRGKELEPDNPLIKAALESL